MSALSPRAAALVGLGVLAGLLLAVLMPVPDRPRSVEWLQAPKPVAAFELVGAAGAFTLQNLQQGWHLVLFGYSECPDICPASLAELRVLAAALPDLPLRVVFVAVDSERESPEQLQGYVRYFHPDFLGVTGDAANLRALADSIGVRFELPAPGSGRAIAHSITLSLDGPGGLLRGRLRPGFDVTATAGEIAERVIAGA